MQIFQSLGEEDHMDLTGGRIAKASLGYEGQASLGKVGRRFGEKGCDGREVFNVLVRHGQVFRLAMGFR